MWSWYICVNIWRLLFVAIEDLLNQQMLPRSTDRDTKSADRDKFSIEPCLSSVLFSGSNDETCPCSIWWPLEPACSKRDAVSRSGDSTSLRPAWLGEFIVSVFWEPELKGSTESEFNSAEVACSIFFSNSSLWLIPQSLYRLSPLAFHSGLLLWPPGGGGLMATAPSEASPDKLLTLVEPQVLSACLSLEDSGDTPLMSHDRLAPLSLDRDWFPSLWAWCRACWCHSRQAFSPG